MQYVSNSVDLITYDAKADEYILIISKTGMWENTDREKTFLRSKIDNYLQFSQNGQLEKIYPQAAGKSIKIQIDCDTLPPSSIGEFIDRLKENVMTYGLQLEIKLL